MSFFKNFGSYLDTSRGLRFGGGGEDVHHCGAGDRVRHGKLRGVRGDLLGLDDFVTKKGVDKRRFSWYDG